MMNRRHIPPPANHDRGRKDLNECKSYGYTSWPKLFGHKNWVLSVAWSPDGKHIVSGSKAGELQIWDPQTGKLSGNPLITLTLISYYTSGPQEVDYRHFMGTCAPAITMPPFCKFHSEDCTIKVWETKQGKLIRELKGHGHWVNSLALSTEYVLRTGAFDHTGKQYASPEEMKEAALERYNKMKGNAPERLVSGSDDLTMFLWEPAISKHPKSRMTGHQQVDLTGAALVNHVYFSPDGQWIASASFDKSVKLWNGVTGAFVAAFRGHVGPVYQISSHLGLKLLKEMVLWDGEM
ncbi:hypothetical protein ACLOJK_007525 [Asimina triloba]